MDLFISVYTLKLMAFVSNILILLIINRSSAYLHGFFNKLTLGNRFERGVVFGTRIFGEK